MILPTFQTERLSLLPLASHYGPQLFTIYSDPEVSRFLGDGQPVPSLEEQEARLARTLEAMQKYPRGLGIWAINDRDSEDTLGVLLLKPLPQDTRVEIGWHLARPAWGKGFASEAAAAVMEYGVVELRLPEVFAVIRPDNSRSAAVARRLGMELISQTNRYYGHVLDVYVALGKQSVTTGV